MKIGQGTRPHPVRKPTLVVPILPQKRTSQSTNQVQKSTLDDLLNLAFHAVRNYQPMVLFG